MFASMSYWQTKLTPNKTLRSFNPPTATQAAGIGSSAKFLRVAITESMVQDASGEKKWTCWSVWGHMWSVTIGIPISMCTASAWNFEWLNHRQKICRSFSLQLSKIDASLNTKLHNPHLLFLLTCQYEDFCCHPCTRSIICQCLCTNCIGQPYRH